ncbi:MAG: ATP-binding protein [Candidatus Promineifilaceae bacterium]
MIRFLLVDDDAHGLYMLRSLLEGHGFMVETAVNGQDALEKARLTPPDMIISDILMPVLDGFSLCRAWMQHEHLRSIPFIFYSATYTDAKDEALALSLGAVRFIVKPAEPVDLVTTIETVFKELGDGRLVIPQPPEEEEPVYLKKYNERLIRKLENKMVELEQANQHLKVLYWASTNLTAVRPMRELIYHALRTIVDAMGYAKANYFAFDEESQHFYLLEAIEYTAEELAQLQRQLVFRLGESRGLVGLVGQNRQPLILNETTSDPRWVTIDKTLHSALFVPVIHEERLLGVISMFSAEPNAFTQEHTRDMMTLANNVAIAMENSRLYEAQQQYAEQLEAQVAARTAELQVALEQAQAADKLKSQFVSNMNHELRTPLSVIKLSLELLVHGRPENWARYINTLNRETERLQIMVEEVLDISRLDLGSTKVYLEPVDLNQLIGNLIMDRIELAAAKGLTLDYEPVNDFPLVLADKQLIFQVLTNLLVNAINYTSKGGVMVCTGTAVIDNQKWLTASVSDTGPGISDEDKAHLFERFYRGEASQKSSASGTGLGLAICQEIMDRHQGRISVASAQDEGSTFTIWLRPAPSFALE